ncbi:MAG: M15 family metallopeptidase [Marmoricola sp.]
MEHRRLVRLLGAITIAAVLSGCASEDGGEPSAASPGTQPSTSASASATPSRAPTPSPTPAPTPQPAEVTKSPALGTIPPTWLGKRRLPLAGTAGFGVVRPTPAELRQRRFTLPDQLPPLPGRGFASRVDAPAPARVLARSTWKPGCPVAATDLSWVRLTFWGFDHRRHTGELLVHQSVADDLVGVFRALYDERFPIEEMRITRLDELDAPPTGDGNNTGVFACRVTTGGSSYSQHAYGLAIDVNPFQNPYLKDGQVLPELASSYLARGRVRPGMITPGGPVARAFAGIGWPWGGEWQSLKDYQHFSQNGR